MQNVKIFHFAVFNTHINSGKLQILKQNHNNSFQKNETMINGDNQTLPWVQNRITHLFLTEKIQAKIFLLENLSSNVKISCARGRTKLVVQIRAKKFPVSVLVKNVPSKKKLQTEKDINVLPSQRHLNRVQNFNAKKHKKLSTKSWLRKKK